MTFERIPCAPCFTRANGTALIDGHPDDPFAIAAGLRAIAAALEAEGHERARDGHAAVVVAESHLDAARGQRRGSA